MNIQDENSTHTRLKSSVSTNWQDLEVPAPEKQSDFGESGCGEPLASQHLVIDFTPTDEDTEFVQKKCCAFWDFLMTCPELEQYKVLPEPHASDRYSNSSDVEMEPIRSEYPNEQEQAKTAVSMLEFVEEKGLITRAFESKLQKSRCSDGSADYFEDSNVSGHDAKNARKAEVCSCKKVCKSTTKAAEQPTTSLDKVHEMCEQLQDWDAHHPKSMEPPGHPPSLSQL